MTIDELAKVKAERDTWRERASINIDQHRSGNTRLRERLAEANKALEPFAAQSENPQWWNDGSIKREHLRAARRALNAGGSDNG